MPDRAKITKGFPRDYQALWEKIEHDQPIPSIAESAVDAIKSDIKNNGSGSHQFINELSEYLKVFEGGSLMSQIVEWDKEHNTLHQIKQRIMGNERFLECVERAGRTILIDLEKGRRLGDIKAELQVRFEKEVGESRLSAPVGASDEQKNLLNYCRDPIENLLRESYAGQKPLIKNPEDGNLADWNFG